MLFLLQFLLAFGCTVFLIKFLIRKTSPTLSWAQVSLIILSKIAAGCFYGWLFFTQYGGDDTWIIHADSIAEWENLKANPLSFLIHDVDLYQYIHDYGWKEGLPYFRMKLEKALINKPLGLFNFYSQGNYYLNVIAFSFISFWGSFWLYQTLAKLLPSYKWFSFLILFFYPPALFWLSGIRSDAMLLFFFGLLLHQLYCLKYEQTHKRHYLLAACAWGGLIIIKASFAFLLLIPVFAWWMVRPNQNPAYSFFGLSGLAILLYFASGYLPTPFNFPQNISNVQAEFLLLDGNTRIDLPVLSPNPMSYLNNLPEALDNVFLRPYPWEAKGMLQMAMVAQNIFIICLAVLALLRLRHTRPQFLFSPFLWLLVFFCVSFYLSIGYTIPFPGAVVRYRVIAETLLVWILGIIVLRQHQSHYFFFNVYKKGINS